jgi:hypothetical protein
MAASMTKSSAKGRSALSGFAPENIQASSPDFFDVVFEH